MDEKDGRMKGRKTRKEKPKERKKEQKKKPHQKDCKRTEVIEVWVKSRLLIGRLIIKHVTSA